MSYQSQYQQKRMAAADAIRVVRNGDTIIVMIDERPIIANVSFIGLKEFDTEALT